MWGNRFAFATAALLHATWKFCVNNNATCRLKTAEQSKMQRETGGGAGRRAGALKKLLNNNGVCMLVAQCGAWHGVGVACLHIKCLIIYEGKIVKKQSLSAENF